MVLDKTYIASIDNHSVLFIIKYIVRIVLMCLDQ